MTLLQCQQDVIKRTPEEIRESLHLFLKQENPVGVLLLQNSLQDLHSTFIEWWRRKLGSDCRQEILLDAEDFAESSFPELFLDALIEARTEGAFRIDLPLVLQNNQKINSPFINRAVHWQRLCDRLIEDEEPARSTLLVLDHFEEATTQAQHELARLIRFHRTHRIRRTFLVVLRGDGLERLEPELRDLIDERIEL